MKVIVADKYFEHKQNIIDTIAHFNSKGEEFGDQKRNSIKLFKLENCTMNIKSFKIPNAVNKIAYKFFRKSKAKRSYEYANYLRAHSIGTPQPIAFAENFSAFTFGKSFYASEHIQSDLTYRELVTNPQYPNHEQILRAFTRFTFDLQEKNVEFLDHSPGNTLIQKHGNEYKFYLVDLNRMNFKALNFEERMKNFSRLTPKKEMVEIMSSEYAKLYDKPEAEIFAKMWQFTTEFQERFHRKKALKKKLKFWK